MCKLSDDILVSLIANSNRKDTCLHLPYDECTYLNCEECARRMLKEYKENIRKGGSGDKE